MIDGFIKVAAVSPDIKVADIDYNKENIIKNIIKSNEKGVSLVVFPELCITGYTCGDLFLQKELIDAAMRAIICIAEHTAKCECISIIGMPLCYNDKLYNCAAVICKGEILGFIPKTNIPNYTEFYELRYFAPAPNMPCEIKLSNNKIAMMHTKLLFESNNNPEFTFAVEICEDLWTASRPSASHALAGAKIIANLSASNETIGKRDYRRQLTAQESAQSLCAYIYADAGEGESTTDLIYSGHCLIAENGVILNESIPYTNGMITADVDLLRLSHERRRINTFMARDGITGYTTIKFDVNNKNAILTRKFEQKPFVPRNITELSQRCNDILMMQALGLKKRLMHTNVKNAVVGLSGGLDSTLALIVILKAYELAGLDKKGIIAVTMPCFGTTGRTYNNAVSLANLMGVTLKEINIENAVKVHLEDIGHDNSLDIAYENAQARERTQVLMDIANMVNGLVIGTADLSEIALGWATYNGDHMSMYAVNCSVPKTLVRHLIKYYADNTEDHQVSKVLKDILDTPVSPELLPPKDGEIAQKTEDIVGDYQLHDFFLYYAIRWGYTPKRIYDIACTAFNGEYTNEEILKWLKNFYKRFFNNQFKRSCLPDGPKIGSVSLSQRGDWRMPSDAMVSLWLKELEMI